MEKNNQSERPNRDRLVEMGFNETVIFENPDYDSAIIGVTLDGRAIYDYDKMVEHLVDEDGMTEDDAMDFIDYNAVRSLPYQDKHPIIVTKYGDD